MADNVPLARLIVCEHSRGWAIRLRQVLQNRGIRVYETRSLTECWQEASRSPASMLVVELTNANPEPIIQFVDRIFRELPHARVVVLGQRGMESYEWILREAGVVHVQYSPRDMRSVARMAERHLVAAPPADMGTLEQIRAGLPWG